MELPDGNSWRDIEGRSIYSVYLDSETLLQFTIPDIVEGSEETKPTFKDYLDETFSQFIPFKIVPKDEELPLRPFFTLDQDATASLALPESVTLNNGGDIHFIDIENDNDIDGFQISEGNVLFYENVDGVFQSPSSNPREFFKNIKHKKGVLKKNQSYDTTFADIDSDNDQDLFIHDLKNEKLLFFKNNQSKENDLPSFDFKKVLTNPFDLPSLDSPEGGTNDNLKFMDLDSDGDLDIYFITAGIDPSICGLNIIENVGSASKPSFSSKITRSQSIMSRQWNFADIDVMEILISLEIRKNLASCIMRVKKT